MSSRQDHICVCICTYKRPVLLKKLLEHLLVQESGGEFTFSVVVVDNDELESARDTVQGFSGNETVRIKYVVEPEKNISMARNMAVRNAEGDFVAFIDDDEFPVATWLRNLYSAIKEFRVDGALGPVVPHFENPPPQWVLRSRLLDRQRFRTGKILNPCDTRTGNVLLSKSIFKGENEPFAPQFGKIGGEDGDFFRRMFDKKFRFVWCDEAVAYETTPPERFTRGYFLKRALLRGISQARLRGRNKEKSRSTSMTGVMKSLVAIFVYTCALPLLFFAGHHLFMKILVKDCDHIGKIFSLLGIDLLKQRNF
jgi:succinoglycan biosynthesis protein ExoM